MNANGVLRSLALGVVSALAASAALAQSFPSRPKYAAHLAQRRPLVLEFLQSIGIAPKP